MKNTQIIVNKQEQKITELVEETTDNSNKISQVEQTVDDISQQIKAEYNFLEEREGKLELYLEDSLNYQPVSIKFNGNTDTVFIYPSSNLYPMSDTYAIGLGDGE